MDLYYAYSQNHAPSFQVVYFSESQSSLINEIHIHNDQYFYGLKVFQENDKPGI